VPTISEQGDTPSYAAAIRTPLFSMKQKQVKKNVLPMITTILGRLAKPCIFKEQEVQLSPTRKK
jgi:hypothetical protein